MLCVAAKSEFIISKKKTSKSPVTNSIAVACGDLLRLVMQFACRNWVIKSGISWVVNELDMHYNSGRKRILCEIFMFDANIMVFKNHFCPRFKVISKKKVITRNRSLVMHFSSSKSSDL